MNLKGCHKIISNLKSLIALADEQNIHDVWRNIGFQLNLTNENHNYAKSMSVKNQQINKKYIRIS